LDRRFSSPLKCLNSDSTFLLGPPIESGVWELSVCVEGLSVRCLFVICLFICLFVIYLFVCLLFIYLFVYLLFIVDLQSGATVGVVCTQMVNSCWNSFIGDYEGINILIYIICMLFKNCEDVNVF
jgi:hypothetical protein